MPFPFFLRPTINSKEFIFSIHWQHFQNPLYYKYEGCYRQTVSPVCYKEVTALLAGGRLLLFYDLNDQTGQADKYNAKLKQFLIGNHIDHPLSFDQGQEVSPLKRGKPPTQFLLVAPGPFYHIP